MNMSDGVLAIAEQIDGVFRKASFEAVSEGKRIAQGMGAKLTALVMGSGVEDSRPKARLLRGRRDRCGGRSRAEGIPGGSLHGCGRTSCGSEETVRDHSRGDIPWEKICAPNCPRAWTPPWRPTAWPSTRALTGSRSPAPCTAARSWPRWSWKARRKSRPFAPTPWEPRNRREKASSKNSLPI